MYIYIIYIWTRIRPYSVPEYAQMHFIHRMHRLVKKSSYSELPVIDFLWPWECQTSHELHPSTGYLTLRWPKAISWKILRPQVTTCNFGAKVIVISTSHWNLILVQPLGFERPWIMVSRCMLNPVESIGAGWWCTTCKSPKRNPCCLLWRNFRRCWFDRGHFKLTPHGSQNL